MSADIAERTRRKRPGLWDAKKAAHDEKRGITQSVEPTVEPPRRGRPPRKVEDNGSQAE